MKKILFILFCLSLSACCKQDDCDDGELPDCIQRIIADVNLPPFYTIRSQKFLGDCYYRLDNRGFWENPFDVIINDNCDTLCMVFEYGPDWAGCEKYEQGNWIQVWPK